MTYLIVKFFKFCNKTKCTCALDNIFNYDLSVCCFFHDRNYKNQNVSRYKADKLFYNCLKNISSKYIAIPYFLAVRIFGWIWWLKSKKENIK